MSYVALATITLTSTTSSVTFSSIPNTFRDLVLIVNSTSSTGAEGYSFLRFNNDSGANYGRVEMVGSAASSSSGIFSNLIPITYRGTPTNQVIQIMDYAQTNKHKTVIYRNNQSDSVVVAGAGRWANTAAITTVAAVSFSLAFASGSTLSLYGISG